MGVIDEEYIRKANDPAAVVGRRIRVAQQEVTLAIRLVEALGARLFCSARPHLDLALRSPIGLPSIPP
jgi:hypothetical protein